MSTEPQKQSSAAKLAALKNMFGSPMVLKSESMEAYENLLAKLVACFDPEDAMELLFVQQMMDGIWEYIRYKRHTTQAIDRRFDAQLESEAKRLKAELEKTQTRERSAKTGSVVSELERKLELEGAIENVVDDVTKILDRNAIERAGSRAFEFGIDYYERLQKQSSFAIGMRNNALELLERYRAGLGHSLRQASNRNIDAECNNPESPAQKQVVLVVASAEGSGISPNFETTIEGSEAPSMPIETALVPAVQETQNAETPAPQAEQKLNSLTEPSQ